jgi:hypothetical protein
MNAIVLQLPYEGMSFYRDVSGGAVREDQIKRVHRYRGQVVVELVGVEGYFGWIYWAGRQSDLKAAFEFGDLVVD